MARQRRSRARRLGFAQRARARGWRKRRGSTCMQASPCARATAKDWNARAATARGHSEAWSACAILADGRVADLLRHPVTPLRGAAQWAHGCFDGEYRGAGLIPTGSGARCTHEVENMAVLPTQRGVSSRFEALLDGAHVNAERRACERAVTNRVPPREHPLDFAEHPLADSSRFAFALDDGLDISFEVSPAELPTAVRPPVIGAVASPTGRGAGMIAYRRASLDDEATDSDPRLHVRARRRRLRSPIEPPRAGRRSSIVRRRRVHGQRR